MRLTYILQTSNDVANISVSHIVHCECFYCGLQQPSTLSIYQLNCVRKNFIAVPSKELKGLLVVVVRWTVE
jgi:hypothetical protein